MLKILMLLAFPLISFAQSNCDELFEAREKGLQSARDAFACFEKQTSTQRIEKAHALNRMSYLKFFMGEYFLTEKLDPLYEALTLGEKSVLLFGEKYSLDQYAKLSDQELSVLAEGLYTYGLSVARYVDLKGKLEAIKRMEDIKKSMNTIIRIKREETAFYGAHRTLGIFHTKVPGIAGGQIQLAGPYLQKAIQGSLYKGTLSLYPSNNVSYADLLFKQGNNSQACVELKAVVALTASDVKAMDNHYYLESMDDVRKAKELFAAKRCP